jgi:RNA polymerase sigma-70 factor (ECF subfamily)
MTTFPSTANPGLLDPATSGIEKLLGRMRAGDRAAAGEFMDRFGSRIRRRIRFKLSAPMRRLFDSQEILSTVARRLDLYVGREKVEARAPEELWSLVFRIADNALIDKVRLFRRLEAVEGSDSQFATSLLSTMRRAEQGSSSGVELEMDRVFRSLENKVDREILSLWLSGDDQPEIARQLGITQDTVRQRWCRLRERLRELIEDGSL